MKTHLGILGSHSTTDGQYQLGMEVGREIAQKPVQSSFAVGPAA